MKARTSFSYCIDGKKYTQQSYAVDFGNARFFLVHLLVMSYR
jgi:hypothetical protein